jgi:hypothetical protein
LIAGGASPSASLRSGRRASWAVSSSSSASWRSAGADSEIAALWSRIQTKLLDVQRSIVEQLREQDALARGLDVGTATDILWTLNHPTVWHLLVRERGWTAEQYEGWLSEAFCSQLLRARNDM